MQMGRYVLLTILLCVGKTCQQTSIQYSILAVVKGHPLNAILSLSMSMCCTGLNVAKDMR
jgi:hypothetical protein